MGAPQHVLVVDDYFEILSYLKSLLELADESVRVVGVPSAEEGILELHQTDYRLLITDLRLPGIDGFDLVRRARRLRPDVAIIMMTAYDTPEARRAAAEIGVTFLRKPLDADAILGAARTALARPAGGRAVESHRDVRSAQPTLLQALGRLCRQADAADAILFSADGTPIEATSTRYQQAIAPVLSDLAAVVRRGSAVVDGLGVSAPEAGYVLQYAGQILYATGIGPTHCLALTFATAGRKASIPPALASGRRLLASLLAPASSALQETSGAAVAPAADPDTGRRPVGDKGDRTDGHQGITASVSAAADGGKTAGSRPETPLSASAETEPETDLSWLVSEPLEDVDLDAYWAEATATVDQGAVGSGLSWEEAVARGLVPPRGAE
jgi:DNA-binding response OmpR family regulator